ncbi:testis-specific expressed protein 55 [Choloepus didactylus]|uniref:testis-specific expressed protein 55 n=1 Tax=Choloepus didactylus TaxID=27675 RepID=UPI0018A0FBA3|nr:testis-specific expressed protein 55 [Choloepus didactylus]
MEELSEAPTESLEPESTAEHPTASHYEDQDEVNWRNPAEGEANDQTEHRITAKAAYRMSDEVEPKIFGQADHKVPEQIGIRTSSQADHRASNLPDIADHRAFHQADNRASSQADHVASEQTDGRWSVPSKQRRSEKTDQGLSVPSDLRLSEQIGNKVSDSAEQKPSEQIHRRPSVSSDPRPSEEIDRRLSVSSDRRPSEEIDRRLSDQTDHRASVQTHRKVYDQASGLDKHEAESDADHLTDDYDDYGESDQIKNRTDGRVEDTEDYLPDYGIPGLFDYKTSTQFDSLKVDEMADYRVQPCKFEDSQTDVKNSKALVEETETEGESVNFIPAYQLADVRFTSYYTAKHRAYSQRLPSISSKLDYLISPETAQAIETKFDSISQSEQEKISHISNQTSKKKFPPIVYEDPYQVSLQYMEKHNILQIFQITENLVYEKPEDPLHFMLCQGFQELLQVEKRLRPVRISDTSPARRAGEGSSEMTRDCTGYTMGPHHDSPCHCASAPANHHYLKSALRRPQFITQKYTVPSFHTLEIP